MDSAGTRRIAEHVAGSIQIPPEMVREADDHIPQSLKELAEHAVLVKALLARATETNDPLVKEVLEGSAIGLTTRAIHLLMKMEVAEAVSLRRQESDNARRQEVWSGIPLQDELLLELVVKLPLSIQRPLVEQWFKTVGA